MKLRRHKIPESSRAPSGQASVPRLEPAPTKGPVSLFLRLAPGIHAVKGAEVEIYDNGSRIAGGNDIVEFNLWVETWVEIRVLR